MNYYVFELQLKNQDVKSNKIQNLMQSLTEMKHETYIRILDFLVAFKQNEREVNYFYFNYWHKHQHHFNVLQNYHFTSYI